MMGLCLNKPVYQGGIRPSMRITMTSDAEKRFSVLCMTLHYNDAADIVKVECIRRQRIVWLTPTGERIQSGSVHRIPWK